MQKAGLTQSLARRLFLRNVESDWKDPLQAGMPVLKTVFQRPSKLS